MAKCEHNEQIKWCSSDAWFILYSSLIDLFCIQHLCFILYSHLFCVQYSIYSDMISVPPDGIDLFTRDLFQSVSIHHFRFIPNSQLFFIFYSLLATFGLFCFYHSNIILCIYHVFGNTIDDAKCCWQYFLQLHSNEETLLKYTKAYTIS